MRSLEGLDDGNIDEYGMSILVRALRIVRSGRRPSSSLAERRTWRSSQIVLVKA